MEASSGDDAWGVIEVPETRSPFIIRGKAMSAPWLGEGDNTSVDGNSIGSRNLSRLTKPYGESLDEVGFAT